MTQHIRKIRDGRENVFSFVRPSEPDLGANALNLVYQAAEVFSDLEARARETEARAHSMCEAATERLRLRLGARLRTVRGGRSSLKLSASSRMPHAL